MNDAAL